MGNRKSLGSLISKYAIFEILYSAFLFIFLLIFFNILVNNKIIYPANHAEVNLYKVEEMLKKDDFSPYDIPYYYDYKYYKNGQEIKNTIDHKYQNHVKNAEDIGMSSTNSIINTKYFKKLTYENKDLVLVYQVSPIFASEKLYRKIKNVELSYLLSSFVIWLIGFTYLIKKTQKIIKSEINLIAASNENIKNMNLDYDRKSSKYTEIQSVLDSLDIMAIDLKKSLHDQWQTEKNQKDLIESITHDIRTPLTLIKGNAELIKENQCDFQKEYIDGIEIGLRRLNVYIEKLNNFSKNTYPNFEVVDKDVVNYWILIAKTILINETTSLIIVSKETSDIKLDKEQIATAIQNIVINACEHNNKKGNIYLSLENHYNTYTIKIKDEGPGFNKAILEQFPQKNITTKSDKINHGLGLSIANDLIKNNRGHLKISNYNENNKSGAQVKMIFKK